MKSTGQALIRGKLRFIAAVKCKGFKPQEEASIRSICQDKGFMTECRKIRLRYERNLNSLPGRKPAAEAKHYRTFRRAFQPKPRHNITPPLLRPYDVVSLALIDPDLRVWEEPAKSQRVAAAFKQLEQQPRSKTSNPQWPENMAANALKRLFSAYRIPFTDFDDSRGTGARGKAATVLAAILGGRCDLRHLIRLAQGKTR